MKRLSNVNKLILGSLLLIAITNPWSVGYIGAGVDTAVIYFTLYANYVFVIGLVLLGAVNVYMMWANREQTKLPKPTKNRQTKDGIKSKLKLLED